MKKPPDGRFFYFLIYSFAYLFICLLLIKECRLVAIYFLEYRAHERLANKAASIGDAVFLAEAIQYPHFALVEQDGDFIFAGLLFQ